METRSKIRKAALIALAIQGILFAGLGVAEEGITRLYWEDATALPLPASEDLVELGRATYSTRCLICHGPEGEGDGVAAEYLVTKPRNFAAGTFKYRTTPQGSFPRDDDLFRTITVGFPIYGMPSFSYLSEQVRWGLVHYSKNLAYDGKRKELAEDGSLDADEIEEIVEDLLKPERALRPAEGPEWSEEVVAKGKEVYAKLECARCHGETGMGDGPSAGELRDGWGNEILPVPFALNEYHMKAGGRARDIVRVLKMGVGGTPMPMYGEEKEEDYWSLAYYVLELSR